MLSRCRTIRIQKASAVLKRGALASSPNGVSVSEDAGHPRLPFVDSAPHPAKKAARLYCNPPAFSWAITPTMNTLQLRNSFLLLLTAVIWGVAFVAQSVGMDYVGPYTFTCVRSFYGGLFLIPASRCSTG